MKSLNEVIDYALSFYGMPYQWGGTGINPDWGIDCSGLVQRILKFADIDPPGDQTADALYRHFLERGIVNMIGAGALNFFGGPTRIIHVGFSITSKVMIHAGGGGSHVRSPNVAQRVGASVKIEPVSYRKDFVASVMPLYQLTQ